jgi:transcriptional regulator with XRE-family HTH domain
VDRTVVGDDGTTPRGAEIGARLRAAREAAGLTVADVGQRTRVPLRHLEAIERGEYEALPSQTYAVGFARAYARAVGLDDVATAAEVRAALARVPRAPDYQPYEIPDPARVPSRGLAILGAGAALALLILAALWFGTGLLHGRADTGPATEPVPAAKPAPAALPSPAAATPAPVTGGQVRLTATGRVWLRVYDGGGKTLFENTLNPGDHYDVPPDAADPLLAVGRPDKLAVTLNGSAVPPLGDGSRAIRDVKVGGAAIAARLGGGPSPAPSTAAVAPPGMSGTSQRPAAASRRPHPPLSETQRANLDAAAAPASAGNSTP